LRARCNMRRNLSGSSCGVPIRIGPRICRGIQFAAECLRAAQHIHPRANLQ
jgi:hypothetical protein